MDAGHFQADADSGLLQVSLVDILREDESTPESYPAPPGYLSEAARLIDKAIVWQRLESWITQRFSVREVQWIVEGCGGFIPRLTPAVRTKAEKWNGNDWEVITPTASPMGVMLAGGTYRLTYDVGTTDTPPDTVLQAYARLAEYWAETEAEGGATSITDGDYSVTRSANAVARALQYSGAADLLRAFR